MKITNRIALLLLYLMVLACKESKEEPVPEPIASFSVGTINQGEVSFINNSEHGNNYSWNFGDGNSSTEQNPTHTYEEAGDFTVKLTVTNETGSATADKVVSLIAPVAQFTVSLDGAVATFTNSSLNATSYSWNFGDGTNSNEESPTHTYSQAGTYIVELTATRIGSDMESEQIKLNAPIAGFSFTIDQGMVTFVNESEYADQYEWDFGDGQTSSEVSPVHTYAADGDYSVTLKAIGIGKDTNTEIITVQSFSNNNYQMQQAQFFSPNPRSAEFFGGYVDSHRDYMIASGQGQAVIYVQDGDSWQEQQVLTSSGSTGTFGVPVAISDSYAAVGTSTGQIVLFSRSGTDWSEHVILSVQNLSDFNNVSSLSLSDDMLIVSDDNANRTGVVVVFTNKQGNWSQTQQIIPDELNDFDAFGTSTALTKNYLAIGSQGDDEKAVSAGAVYLYENDNGTWLFSEKLFASDASSSANFGYSIDLDVDVLIVGSPGLVEGAYIFNYSNGSWIEDSKLQPSTNAANIEFGYSVGITGNYLLVGSPSSDDLPDGQGIDNGCVFVFMHSGGSWLEMSRLLANDASSIDKFGTSLSMSSEGAIISAPSYKVGNAASAGTVYIFR